ncbi:MAG: hypothetical protein GAK37_02752 [Pseudomonas sp.]|nr:MAG: hypothetical protein GAK37_02752 [Pseudomonas sp.]
MRYKAKGLVMARHVTAEGLEPYRFIGLPQGLLALLRTSARTAKRLG